MLGIISKQYGSLKADFWGTLALWQNQRPIWLLGAGIALFLEVFSWLFFQNYLKLDPCELCVYIRFSMVTMFIGGLFAAISPQNLFFKLGGYTIVIWGLIKGILWNIALEKEHLNAAADDWMSGCSPVTVKFPFGLPLDNWLPSHFLPTGICGQDGWSLFGLNMAEWLFIVYGCFLIFISLMLISCLVASIRGHKTNL